MIIGEVRKETEGVFVEKFDIFGNLLWSRFDSWGKSIYFDAKGDKLDENSPQIEFLTELYAAV